MSVTLSVTNFTAGTITPVELSFSGGDMCTLEVESAGLYLSLDGTVISRVIRVNSSPSTIYVRCYNTIASGTHEIHYIVTSGSSMDEGIINITVTGGSTQNFESISFGFVPRATTVQFNANTVKSNLALRSKVSGTILDYHFGFEVEQVQEQGQRRIVNGSSHAEMLVNSLITYSVNYTFDLAWLGWRRPSLTDHISAISSAIGKQIVFRGANFYPKTDMNIMLRKNFGTYTERISGSFAEILNRLIGWSDTVPNMVYNLYVENDIIYIVQRGYEQNTRTPANWGLTPTLTHTIRRTQWGNSDTQTVIPKEVTSSDAANSNEPFSGTISWGSSSLTYVDGYLTTETRGNSTTTYTYTEEQEGKYLTQKETVDTDGEKFSRTTFTYQSTGKEKYLYEETTNVYDGTDDTGTLESSTLTRHVPIGNGWYGTTIYNLIDGEEEVSTSLSQGAPGNKASQYCIDKANDALKPNNAQRQMSVPLRGVAKARQSYPVADYDTLEAIANALDSYEGKEEITLNGEIVGGDHIYTYDDKIIYNGNTYFIVANNVNRTYNTIRQNITAVRWVIKTVNKNR